MDAIILAGGRGRRLGALTHARQKGSLSIIGRPIVSRIIDTLLVQPDVERILVATGYRGGDIQLALSQTHPMELAHGRILIIDSPNIKGNLKRFAHTLDTGGVKNECFCCGIDTLVPEAVIRRLLNKVAQLKHPEVLIPISRKCEIAPSHPRMIIDSNEMVVEYCAKPLETKLRIADWYTSLGIRYVAGQSIAAIKSYAAEGLEFSRYAKFRIENQQPIHAMRFDEQWRHFGIAADFNYAD